MPFCMRNRRQHRTLGWSPAMYRFAAAALVTLGSCAALAQQPLPPPTPLYPGAAPRSIEPEALPPLPSSPVPPPVASTPVPAAPPPPAVTLPAAVPPAPAASMPSDGPATQRVFCDQPVTVRLPDRTAFPEPYRQFIGVWSDAAWTPQPCAAPAVDSVRPAGR